MDYIAHYRRARALLIEAERTVEIARTRRRRAKADLLHHAEVLAWLATARAQMAWVAYMGAEVDAAAQLAERDLPAVHCWEIRDGGIRAWLAASPTDLEAARADMAAWAKRLDGNGKGLEVAEEAKPGRVCTKEAKEVAR